MTDSTDHPQDPRHVDDCLPCSIRRATQELGMDPAPAGLIIPLLPVHLRQPFWREVVETTMAQQLAAIDQGTVDD